MTVTLRATADTSLEGTPPAPVTCTSTDCPGPTLDETPPVPVRVSRMRAGVTGVKRPVAGLTVVVTGGGVPAVVARKLLLAVFQWVAR